MLSIYVSFRIRQTTLKVLPRLMLVECEIVTEKNYRAGIEIDGARPGALSRVIKLVSKFSHH